MKGMQNKCVHALFTSCLQEQGNTFLNCYYQALKLTNNKRCASMSNDAEV